MLKFIDKKLEGKTFAEINCGIGGFGLSLESMGAKSSFAVETDKHAADVYEKNFKERPATILKDIPEHDILVVKFPYCSSKNTKSNSFNANDIISVIAFKKPEIILLESAANSNDVILKILEKLGYIVHCSILNALNYGVPQNRKSVYVVAFRKDIKVNDFKFPEPIALTKHVEDILEPESNIPAKMYVDRPDVVMNSKDLNMYSNKPIQIGYVAKNRQGERIYSKNACAPCLVSTGGGQFSKTGGYLINNKLRKLTKRESARLMGFPDDFMLSESNNQAYMQLGNSVVVDVIQMILESIASALGDDEDNKNKESVEKDSTLKSKNKNPVRSSKKINTLSIIYFMMLCISKVQSLYHQITTKKLNRKISVVIPT